VISEAFDYDTLLKRFRKNVIFLVISLGTPQTINLCLIIREACQYMSVLPLLATFFEKIV
jgi:hypothetical protein